MCVALNFVNNFGSPFKLYSSLKHEGYLVTGSGFKLKLLIDRPELHSHVIFHAEDPTGKIKILLNGESSISEPTVSGCPEFLTVSVSSGKGKVNGNHSFQSGKKRMTKKQLSDQFYVFYCRCH